MILSSAGGDDRNPNATTQPELLGFADSPYPDSPIYIPGATWFFTVNLAERKGNRLLVGKVDVLRHAFTVVKQRHPFRIGAVVVLPDHLIVFGFCHPTI